MREVIISLDGEDTRKLPVKESKACLPAKSKFEWHWVPREAYLVEFGLMKTVRYGFTSCKEDGSIRIVFNTTAAGEERYMIRIGDPSWQRPK